MIVLLVDKDLSGEHERGGTSTKFAQRKMKIIFHT